MRRRVLELQKLLVRRLAIPGLVVLLSVGSAAPSRAQTGENHAQDQGKQAPANPADATKDNQRKIDEFAEASQAINGPAGNPECVWLGRRVVQLMYRDDLDTAFRHLDLYDRFGCPGGHVQAAFRCLTRFFAQIDDKVPNSLSNHVQACWINPNAQPQAAAAPAAAQPTTASSVAPAPTASPQPSASPQPAAK
jgi:hypothetical protein